MTELTLKRLRKISILILIGFVFSCSSNNEDIVIPEENNSIESILQSLKFPVSSDAKISYTENDAVALSGNPSVKAKKIVETIAPSQALFFIENEVTSSQLEEIRQATEKIVQGATTQEQKYTKIFKWVSTQIQYGTSDNNAYAAFKNRKGVCQGYANLLRLMCYCQKIPAFVVRGYAIVNGKRIGGHAWNYVNTDGYWWVSDPTNQRDYKISAISQHQKYFEPRRLHIALYEDDDFVISYKNAELTLIKVKKKCSEKIFCSI